jgi:hypothetical protein
MALLFAAAVLAPAVSFVALLLRLALAPLVFACVVLVLHRLITVPMSFVLLPLFRLLLAMAFVSLALAFLRVLLLTVPLVALVLLLTFGLHVVPFVSLSLGAILLLVGQQGQEVGRLKGLGMKPDVLGGDVVNFGVLGQPAHLEAVQADDAGVGGRALAEINLAIRANSKLVVVMITQARQAGHQVAHGPGLQNGNLAPVGNVKAFVVPEQVSDRAVQMLGYRLSFPLR